MKNTLPIKVITLFLAQRKFTEIRERTAHGLSHLRVGVRLILMELPKATLVRLGWVESSKIPRKMKFLSF